MHWAHRPSARLLPQPVSLLLLQAYDTHLNMILGDVEEIITATEVDEETYEEIIKARAGLMRSLRSSFCS